MSALILSSFLDCSFFSLGISFDISCSCSWIFFFFSFKISFRFSGDVAAKCFLFDFITYEASPFCISLFSVS